MKNINVFKYFFFILLFYSFFLTTVKASTMTDLGNLNNMFIFETNNEASGLADNSMSFVAARPDDIGFWNKIYMEYHSLITGVSAVCLLTFGALFIINFTKLGTTAGNPQLRKSIQINLLWIGLATAASGAVFMFVGFFGNMFN